MKKIRLFLTMVMIVCSVSALAQKKTVTGTVTDASNGEGVPFVGVTVKGTTTGVATDVNGAYSISVPADAVLVFNAIGYKTAEQTVGSRSVIDVALDTDTQLLDETIVVAYGTTTKAAFTGSAAVLKSDDIAKTQSSNATRAIEGVVPGVQLTTSSGTLGTNPSIRIRGISSITAGKEPLIIVDGAPYSGSMDNLNPTDLESITVLKDAASSALYGARGANGVIIITTKKAKSNQAVVNVDAKWGGNSRALRTYDYIKNPATYYETYYGALYNYYRDKQGLSDAAASLKASNVVAGSVNDGGLGYQIYSVPEGERFIGANGKINPRATLGNIVDYNGEKYLMTPDDWMEAAYRNSLRQEYNVSVSGTVGGKVSILASFGYLNNKGIIEGADMDRFSARLKADYQAKDWLRIGGNFSYAKFEYNNGNSDEGSAGSTGNIFGYAASMAPIYPLYIRDENGNIRRDAQGWKMYDYGNGRNGGFNRPNAPNSNALQLATLDTGNDEGNQFSGNGYAEVSFLKHFKASINASASVYEDRYTSQSNMFYGQFAVNGGTLWKQHDRTFYFNFQQQLSYSQTFGDHTVSAMFVHENNYQSSTSVGAYKTKLFSHDTYELGGAVIDGQNASSSKSEYNNEGYLGQVQYDWKEQVFVSASYRRDASSRFHPDHRWGNFWSAGAGWLMNKASWFNVSWIDLLKVKASVGSLGNDSIGNYLYTDTYAVSNSDGEISVAFNTKGNEKITWETITNFNTGIDVELLGGRLSGSIEYFYRKTKNMLYFFSVPSSLGYDGYYDNIGDMRNSGIELSGNAVFIDTKNVTWTGNLNITRYANKITRLPEQNKKKNVGGHDGYETGNYFYAEGLPIYEWYMPEYAGVNQDNGKPMWYKDELDADGNPTGRRVTTEKYAEADDYLLGDPHANLYGGFGTSLKFYGFDFACQFTYSIGGLSYDSGYATLMDSPKTGGHNIHVDVLNAWTPANHTDTPRFQYLDENFASTSSRFLTDASYLNFQNMQFGYTIPAHLTEKIKLSKVRVYLAADNIWYWSRRHGFDPRYSFAGSTNDSVNSPVRTISGGINLTF